MRRMAGALTLALALGAGGCFGSGDLDFEQGAGGADTGGEDIAAAVDAAADVMADAGVPTDTAADTGGTVDVADATPDVGTVDAGPDVGTPDTGGADACTPGIPYTDVQAIWNQRCNGCHVGGALGGLSLDKGEAEIVGKPSVAVPGVNRIEPGDPANSYVWLKLTDQFTAAGGGGSPMPVGGYPLPQAELDTIEAWIIGLGSPCP